MNTPTWLAPSAYRTGQALANGERDRTEPAMFSPVERSTNSMVMAGAYMFVTLVIILLSMIFGGWALLPALGVGIAVAVLVPWLKMPANGKPFDELFPAGILVVPMFAYLDKGAFAGVLVALWWGIAVWVMVRHMGRIRTFGQMDSHFDLGEYNRRKADVDQLRDEASTIEQTYRP